jgi:hypothetical protein
VSVGQQKRHPWNPNIAGILEGDERAGHLIFHRFGGELTIKCRVVLERGVRSTPSCPRVADTDYSASTVPTEGAVVNGARAERPFELALVSAQVMALPARGAMRLRNGGRLELRSE